jgi:hypothetical protein
MHLVVNNYGADNKYDGSSELENDQTISKNGIFASSA